MAKAKRKSTPKTHALVAKDYSLGSPEFSKPTLKVRRYPRDVQLLMDVCEELGIDAAGSVYVKMETLRKLFLSRGVSDRLAKAFATACRPDKDKAGGGGDKSHRGKPRPFNP
jgi:hypothetical protein